MASKLSYSYSMGDNSIEAGIASIEKRTTTLIADIQKLAVSILVSFNKSGDKPTAARRANALHKALGKGMRANSLLGWFEQNSPMVYNKETKQLVCGFTAASPVKSHTDIPVATLPTTLWQDAVADPEYKPLEDWNKVLQGIIKRAEQDIAKMGDKSKVNAAQLAQIKAMAAVK